jgi:hypothetical protein
MSFMMDSSCAPLSPTRHAECANYDHALVRDRQTGCENATRVPAIAIERRKTLAT